MPASCLSRPIPKCSKDFVLNGGIAFTSCLGVVVSWWLPYLNRGSKVYACLIDNFNLKYAELLERSIVLLELLLHWYKTVSVEWGRLLTFKSPISTVLLILALFCSQSTLNACLSHCMKMSEVLWVESLCSYIMLWGWLHHSYPPSRKKDGSSLLIIHTPCDDIL